VRAVSVCVYICMYVCMYVWMDGWYLTSQVRHL